MAITLAEAFEVVPMLFAVAKYQAPPAEALQVCERVSVGNVIAIGLRAFQVRDEQEVQAVRTRQGAQVFVGLLAREPAQVQVSVAAEPAIGRDVAERLKWHVHPG